MEGFEKIVDVVVLGGSFSGAATALLLRREAPELSVLIVEKSTHFDRKVGEATTEVSGAFLTKRLGMTYHLTHNHIVKNGLRFWFTDSEETTLETAGELGANFQVRMPTYQVDREVLDSHMLKQAEEEGAELLRPAKAVDWTAPQLGCPQTLSVEQEGCTLQIQCRWLVDASGKAAWLARKKGLLRPVPEHPTSAIWARLESVADFDSWQLRDKYPTYGGSVQVSRTSATNHLTGYGWWCWIIPLKGGHTSVGLVYDKRLFTPPEGPDLASRLLSHLQSDPLGKELFREAKVVPGDCKAYSNLPYYTEAIAGPGWHLAGDAAGFMDPLYSAGLDYASWTISSAVNRVLKEKSGEVVDLGEINRNFLDSYWAWMNGLYLDKYFYLGDRRLMRVAFLMDLGLFFFGPVRDVVGCVRSGFAEFPFNGAAGRRVGRVMAFYNQRLAELARQKMVYGIYGEANTGRRHLVPGFEPNFMVWRNILDGAAFWVGEEFRLLFHRLFSRKKADQQSIPEMPDKAKVPKPTL